MKEVHLDKTLVYMTLNIKKCNLKQNSLKLFYFFIFFSEITSTKPQGDDTVPLILLWAILVNRKKLSEILWLRSKDHLCKIKILMMSLKKTCCIVFFK